MPYTGQPLKRFEDPILLNGKGSYVDDMKLPDMLHAIVLRSPHAHARIRSIDTSRALSLPGVVAVLTAQDIAGKVKTIPPRTAEVGKERQRLGLLGDPKIQQHPALATEKVCYVGQAVAVVVVQDRYLLRDALDLISVDYEELPPIMDSMEALKDSSIPIHEELGTNLAIHARVGRGDIEEAFARADHIVRGTYDVPRLSAAPMEGRGLLVQYNAAENLLTLWASTQVPHKVKAHIPTLLNRPELRVRVVAPDVGGGFGQKVEVWPEDLALSYLAIELGHPIKWVEERCENMLAYHGRGIKGDVEAAVKNDGTVLGMRTRMVADVGAFFLTSSPGSPINAMERFAGPYAIETMDVECLVAITNKPPTGPYRGAGGPESAMFMDRTMELVARDLNLDPVEVRRRNLVPRDAFPYATATGLTYDSGDFSPALDRALELGRYAEFRRKQKERKPEEPLMGVGIATVIKASGGRGEMRESNARVAVEPTGEVKVYTEISPHGQGTETTFAQVAADELGIRIEDIQVLHGDSDMLPSGQGTFASRGTAAGGSAMHGGLVMAREKMSRIAAHILECEPEDITFEDGKLLNSKDPEQVMSFSEVALAAQHPESLPPGLESGLDFHSIFTLPNSAYTFGAHVAVVEVDQDTGEFKILHYAAVHDPGNVINPKLMEGQVHGAIAQGLGPATAESIQYSSDGQPLAGTFMDYAMPTAEDMPAINMDTFQTPSPTNPLGAKGAGEVPTMAAPVAVANAVIDALAGAGVRNMDIPLTPEKVLKALRAQGG